MEIVNEIVEFYPLAEGWFNFFEAEGAENWDREVCPGMVKVKHYHLDTEGNELGTRYDIKPAALIEGELLDATSTTEYRTTAHYSEFSDSE